MDLKITQDQAAAKLQIQVCTYRGWEKDQRNPSVQYIPRVVKFLGYIPLETEFDDLGQKIRAYRQLLGLRQKDLALQLGVNPTTVGYLESGEHKPGKRLENSSLCSSDQAFPSCVDTNSEIPMFQILGKLVSVTC